MKKIIITAIVVAVVVGGGAFYGGMQYAKAQPRNPLAGGQGNFQNLTPEQRQQFMQQGGGMGRGGQGGGFTSGEIISKDDKSVTIKLPDGGSKIIFLSDATQVSKYASGDKNDLEVGKNISVTGSANSDGSVTAQSIQLRPALPSANTTVK